MTENPRKPDHPIHPMILKRWSPRAMSGEEISTAELMSLFEAARWAPSSFNNQPWRFLYTHRNSEHWNTFFNLLVAGNQAWAKNAAVLIVVISRNNFEHNDKPARTHTFDAGSAWQNLALQTAENGLAAHAMQGFDYDKAKKDLSIPEDYTVEAMIAIGRPGKKEDLPESMQEREFPSPRKKVAEIIMEGPFKS